ncbi:MAG: DUF6512 family protein [Wenzhouxiangella sp.]|nr:DUF6512 family protein [Wenzhouxiangella sp.]
MRDRYAWLVLTVATVPIFLLGSILHFVYDWSGGWRPVALLGAVNESVWEHLKIAFWPAVLSGLFEWSILGRRYPSFWAARTLGLLVTPVTIAVVFYGYTALLGGHWLIADIGTFLVGIAAGQWVCYAALDWRPARSTRWLLRLVLIGLLVSFSCLTYWPLEWPLFQEAGTGITGIPS